MHLLSDQISPPELAVVRRYCQHVVDSLTDGDFVEFGCFVGTTSVYLQRIALSADRTLHVYDSFAGLPPKTAADNSPAGLEFTAGALAAPKKTLIQNFLKQNLPLPVIHKGWFADLTGQDLPEAVAFAFLDGDFYESIRDSLRLTWPQLSTNGYVLVHDYGRVTLPGAKRAVTEFLGSHTDAKLERTQEHIAVIRKL